jgi:DNA-3-methyladenine glycosylase I
MPTPERPPPPADLSGYLDALARVMFQAGISWRVVDAKWPGIRDAFGGFNPGRVAGLTLAEVDRLLADTRIIRNRKKVEALVGNARKLLDLDAEHHGFARYLDGLGDFSSTSKELRRQFAFLGESGAWFFLWMVGRPVPAHGER